MERGGILTVSTETYIKKQKQNRRKTDLNAPPEAIPVIQENFIRIRFKDTGTGIKKEDMVKLFDPFFTTKPEDQGTGLGLSVCHTIIEKHAGSIEVESKQGEGATFIIDLPYTTRRESDKKSMMNHIQHSSR
jgi:signal transduction histidine kinase